MGSGVMLTSRMISRARPRWVNIEVRVNLFVYGSWDASKTRNMARQKLDGQISITGYEGPEVSTTRAVSVVNGTLKTE